MSKGKLNFLLDLDSTLISAKKERELNILLENEDDFFDFNRSSDSLLEIEKKLSNLLND